MKRLRVLLSAVLVLSILSLCIVQAFAAENHTVSPEEKISPELAEKMAEAEEDELITIALWLKGVDEAQKKEDINQELHNSMIKGEIVSKDLFDYESYNNYLESKNDLTVSEVQRFIDIKRRAYKKSQTNYGEYVLNDLIDNYGINPENVYISKYSPSILMRLTKSEVNKIEKYDEITIIYLYNNYSYEDSHNFGKTDNSNRSNGDRSNTYGYWKNSTNISVLQNAFGLTGSGIRIGTNDGIPDLSQTVFQNSYNNGRIIIIGDTSVPYSDHGTYTSSIMIGQTNDYSAVAPNATLVCGGWNSEDYIYILSNEEMLIEEGIDILVSFVSVYDHNAPYIVNYWSQYYDFLSDENDVIVCLPSGNKVGAFTNTINTDLGYNVITVGNINDQQTLTTDDDIIQNTSLFSIDGITYKPDISAPGANVITPVVNGPTGGGGTCAATAVVAGICALLMQEYPLLISHPMLLKSALLSSVRVLPNMNNIYSDTTGTSLPFDRPYGAGMVDAAEAYCLLEDNHYKNYISTSQIASPTSEFNIIVHYYSNYDLFICLTWAQEYTKLGQNSYYQLPTVGHRLCLYDPDDVLVAQSNYSNDRKQFIHYKPTRGGQYKVKIYRTFTGAAYYPRSYVSYNMRFVNNNT